ncbi:MAG TPA: MAPEG family protein [Sphingomicrobium sp.]|nr:MAPEG family protein [Sphingomicrobium sp.]
MTYSPILVPVVVLVAWTLVIMAWMAITRFGAFRKLGVSLGNIPPGSRGVNLEGKAADEVQWKSHNYTHLLEQPTLFYAIALTLALMGMNQPVNVWLAWGYVGLRILHSLIQCTTNIVKYRFPVFALASLCLLGLTVHAGARVLHDCLGWHLF